MPLPVKTLREVSMELGIPESEIKAMVDMRKINAAYKQGKLTFAPDEIAKIKRQRATLPESAVRSSAQAAAAQAPLPAPVRRKAPPPKPKRYEPQ